MVDAAQIPDVLRIEIRHAQGTSVYDPNTLLKTCVMEPSKLLDLPTAGEKSVIYGGPAVEYRTDEFAAWLTPEEIFELTMRTLAADKVVKLREVVGDVFELHGDFYDLETGEALLSKTQ